MFKKGANLASGEAPIQSEMVPECSMLDESLSSKGETKGQMLDQKEPGELYPQEKGRETDMEFRRRRKEMSQVIIHTDVRVT